MNKKFQEVQFYIDRSVESFLMIMRSILENPSIPQAERYAAVKQVADYHATLALMLETRLVGEDVVLSLNRE